ncbi:eukaryotic cytochrome b561 domain-containing protein [Phthorimaea operculella]|nr:eukaryotic cytochrome b561 domain-containing protein [Phthorimaea operculella]
MLPVKSLVRDSLYGEPPSAENKEKPDSGDRGKHLFGYRFNRPTRQTVRTARHEREHKLSYCNLVHIIFMVFAQTAIGSITIITFGFSVLTMDWHVFVCTEGWHFYAAEAILAMGLVNSWGCVRLSTLRRVRYLHAILQCFGGAHVFWGCHMVLKKTSKAKYTTHALLGICTTVMTIVSLLSGPMSLLSRYNQGVKFFHTCLGLPTFIMSTVVISLGILKFRFEKYITKFAIYVLILDISFLTAYITVTVLINAYRRMRVNRVTV